jgi:hypothetical protein
VGGRGEAGVLGRRAEKAWKAARLDSGLGCVFLLRLSEVLLGEVLFSSSAEPLTCRTLSLSCSKSPLGDTRLGCRPCDPTKPSTAASDVLVGAIRWCTLSLLRWRPYVGDSGSDDAMSASCSNCTCAGRVGIAACHTAAKGARLGRHGGIRGGLAMCSGDWLALDGRLFA